MRTLACLLLFACLGLSGQAQQPPASSYRFAYSIDTMAGKPGFIRVHFRLHNNSDSTLYFLRRSCSLAYNLHWNETEWRHQPRIVCRASFPAVDTVAPHEEYEWTTFFGWTRWSPMPEFTYTLQRLEQPQKPRTLRANEPIPETTSIQLRVPVKEAEQ